MQGKEDSHARRIGIENDGIVTDDAIIPSGAFRLSLSRRVLRKHIFSMFAAGRFARVVGVEENSSSVAEAVSFAASNGISNAEFVRFRTEECLAGADSGDIGCALVEEGAGSVGCGRPVELQGRSG